MRGKKVSGRSLGLPLVLISLVVLVKTASQLVDAPFQILDKHNIDLGGLDRSPSLEPSLLLLKVGKHGAISSDLELCSNLTISSVLQKFPEANAADAAVTQALCIGMVNFFNSGVGGGGYALFTGKSEDQHISLDFREMAPQASHKDMFKDCEDCSKVGGLAIGVPGELAGLYELYKTSGSGAVDWSDLLMPVVNLGYEGFEVTEPLAFAFSIYEPFFVKNPHSWEFVLNSTKNGVKKRGDWITRPSLSNMLAELANNGSADPFYDPEHWIGKSMLATIEKNGGVVLAEDLLSYNVNLSAPLQKKIRSGFEYAPNNDLTLLTTSGTSSGAALISALSIMDQFPNQKGGDYQTRTTYQLAEGMKWLASARSRLGDYFGPELPERIQDLLEANWTKRAVTAIKENSMNNVFKTMPDWKSYHPAYDINEPHGTAHFSIVDHHGNAVSLTTTINLLFGSLVHDPDTGVIFNNEMDDFSQPQRSNTFNLTASIYNFPEPGKRPLSSAVPSVILNELGIPDLVVGASGGSRISTSVFQAIIRTYWYNMPLLETVAYPRIHHQLIPNQLEVESIAMIGKDVISELRAMGHRVIEEMPKSVINAIRFVDGEWHAVSDCWRKRGVSSVY